MFLRRFFFFYRELQVNRLHSYNIACPGSDLYKDLNAFFALTEENVVLGKRSLSRIPIARFGQAQRCRVRL